VSLASKSVIARVGGPPDQSVDPSPDHGTAMSLMNPRFFDVPEARPLQLLGAPRRLVLDCSAVGSHAERRVMHDTDAVSAHHDRSAEGGYRTSALSHPSQCVTVIVVTGQSVMPRLRRSR
jgi:hypothetical protein